MKTSVKDPQPPWSASTRGRRRSGLGTPTSWLGTPAWRLRLGPHVWPDSSGKIPEQDHLQDEKRLCLQ